MDSVSPRFHPYAFLLATWAVTVSSNAFYIAPAPVFPEMIGDLAITKAQAGALISAYLVAIFIFQLPAGYLIDRRDPRAIIVISVLSVLGLSLVLYLVPHYETMLALRFFAGIPVAFLFVPSAFLVSRAFEATPGRAVGLFLSGPPAGVALGNLLGPLIAESFGWPAVFIAFTLPWLVLLPLFVYFARSLPLQKRETFAMSDYVTAFRNRELWKVGAVFACSYAAYIFYSSWSPTYMAGTGIVSAALLGILSAAIPAAGILSRPVGGYLAETRLRRDKRRVPVIAFAILAASSVAVPFLGIGAIPLLIAGGFLAQFPFSVYYVLSAQIMPEKFTGSAYALMNTISLIGGAISPGLAGYLADVTGTFVAAFAMIAATALLGLSLILLTRER
ncbi:MAG TPA: MFS transporter [Thermoplasmata archaeon]|jgi:NNP family nitrate/nitrite transporter-like MFS transporter